MGNVMRRLFSEGEASNRSPQHYLQGTCSIPPDLPLLPYYNRGNFFIKLAKTIQVHSVHEKYKASLNTKNNKGTSGISNFVLQGSQQPGN